jgi:hypothetical protein
MRTFLTFAVCLAAVSASAKEHRFDKKIEPFALQQELKAAGFQVRDISCLGTACILRLEDSERKNPKSVIDAHKWEDPQEKRKRELDALRALRDKWKAGTITPAEKDELLRRFIELHLPA